VKETARSTQIVQAAAELWAVKGYHGAGVEELSQLVGLQRGALYHYIGSKEELLQEVVRRAIQRLLDRTAPDESQPAEAQLRAISRILMTDIFEHQAEWTVFFREIDCLTGSRRDEIFQLRDRYEQLWIRSIERAAIRDELRPVADVLLKGVLGMHNYAYLWLRPDGSLAPTEIADLFMDALWNGMGGKATLDE
jgi:AcrR family transcriptional regulator